MYRVYNEKYPIYYVTNDRDFAAYLANLIGGKFCLYLS